MSNLVKSNPFPSVRSMMEDFWNTDRFFNLVPFTGETLPSVNVRETENNYQVEVSAPGFKKDDFKITTDHGFLTISAETSNEQKEEKGDYIRQEFSCSSFSRSFSLPDNAAEDNINAKYRDGLLTIELKKSGKNIESKKQIKIE